MSRRSQRFGAWVLALSLGPVMGLAGCQPAEVGTVGKPREAGADGKEVAPSSNPRAGTEAPAKKGGKAQAPDTGPRK
ncbi:hypothetical protein [Aquisphaera insulae]|uniref:hypothetical protein n=1 Tax=Aquisphaera insulae TaxID=2712864 RepID=UPI0013EAF1D7|nr:hypothetical protein [Aquisphaera insulae]